MSIYSQEKSTCTIECHLNFIAGVESATDGMDYSGIPPQEFVFEDGDAETKIFFIALTDDTEPEVAEQFTVVLSNPPGGSALIDPGTVSITISLSPYVCISTPSINTSELTPHA